MQALAEFRSKAAGLPDLLNYAALVDEGIVQGKDGSLLAGFFFQGDDAGSASDEDRNYITRMVNTYLSRFGSGWAMWVDAVRFPSPGYPDPSRSHFPDPISAMIDMERREMFEQDATHYESEYALILQYQPPLRRESKLAELVYDDDGRDDTSPGDRLLAEFKKRISDFEDGLGDLLHMRRMGTIRLVRDGETYESDQLVNYLHYCLTGEAIALRIPACPMYLDAWLGMPTLWPGDTPRIGDSFIACVAIEGFPSATHPGILSVLDGLQVSYRWSTRYIFLEQHEALGELKKYRRIWQQVVRGFWSQIMRTSGGAINTHALAMTKEAEDAMSVARSGAVAFGYYTPVVVLMSENRGELEEQARYVKKSIERRGFAARIETVNTIEAWLGSLPGHAYPNVRRPVLHTLNLADLLPLSSVWPGLHDNPCGFYPEGSPPLMQTVTTGATPFRLNLHVGDVGHALIFGPTGAGKSTLLAVILAQFRRYRSRSRRDGSAVQATVTAFDKGGSLYALCSAIGGKHYDIGIDDSPDLALCPLADIDTAGDALWAEEWIETCYALRSEEPLTPQQRHEIHRAIALLREAPRTDRSMTHFVTMVQDERLSSTLRHYTVEGGMGHLLDGREDSVRFSNFTVFEIDELMELGSKNAIPVLLYLFRRFEKSLDGQPAILSLDEAWVMLGHPAFREKIRKWLKELRKKNCAVVLATQSLSDATGSGLMDVLIEQCPTKIFLPNKEAESPASAELYRAFNLNPREIELLKNGRYKRDYYYKSPLGRRMFELGLGPLALSFVAISDKDELREVRAFEEEYGSDWPLRWLEKRGIDYEKYIA